MPECAADCPDDSELHRGLGPKYEPYSDPQLPRGNRNQDIFQPSSWLGAPPQQPVFPTLRPCPRGGRPLKPPSPGPPAPGPRGLFIMTALLRIEGSSYWSDVVGPCGPPPGGGGVFLGSKPSKPPKVPAKPRSPRPFPPKRGPVANRSDGSTHGVPSGPSPMSRGEAGGPGPVHRRPRRMVPRLLLPGHAGSGTRLREWR